MVNSEKTDFIFEQYDKYVGSSKKNREWNTFTHFVRFLKSSKNKSSTEFQQALTYISLLIDSHPVEIEYADGSGSRVHNEFIYYAYHKLAFSAFPLYTNFFLDTTPKYHSIKQFYYANSILKYLLKNIHIDNITGHEFKMLFRINNQFKELNINNIYDDTIKYYTKNKVFQALHKKYPEYNY